MRAQTPNIADTHRRPSVRLALPQGTCELPYQYRGHFSRPESLIGIFRQVTMINRDKILRFGEKFEKKIFATTFFRTEICPCLSLLIFSRWLFFSQSAWHYMCHVTYDPVSTNEIADATRGAQTHCAVKPPYCFCVWVALPRGCRILCFFTLYFGLFVVVKPKKTLSGLHWLSFSFERSRISTGEVSSWGRMNHPSCRHSHYLPRAAGGWIGFTGDIHDLWL